MNIDLGVGPLMSTVPFFDVFINDLIGQIQIKITVLTAHFTNFTNFSLIYTQTLVLKDARIRKDLVRKAALKLKISPKVRHSSLSHSTVVTTWNILHKGEEPESVLEAVFIADFVRALQSLVDTVLCDGFWSADENMTRVRTGTGWVLDRSLNREGPAEPEHHHAGPVPGVQRTAVCGGAEQSSFVLASRRSNQPAEPGPDLRSRVDLRRTEDTRTRLSGFQESDECHLHTTPLPADITCRAASAGLMESKALM